MLWILLIATILGHSAALNSEINICSNVTNNLFLPHLTNCSEYYLCMNDQSYLKYCPANYFFNARSQECVTAEEKSCLPSCPLAGLTSFCYDRTCTKYVMCYQGNPVLRECCDGLQYNAETDRCDYPQYVDCVENMCTRNSNISSIVYLASKAKCDKYYVCVDGQPMNQTCASGLQFNPACDCCDFPSRVNCTVEVLQRNILPFAKAPPRRADISCPELGTFFFEHKTRADAYYYCQDGRGITLDCTPGLVYDASREECAEPKN